MEDFLRLVVAGIFVFLIVAFLKWIGFIPGWSDVSKPTGHQQARQLDQTSREHRIPEVKPTKQDRESSLPSTLLPPITIGPWTINEKNKTQASGQVSSDFIGRWTGKIVQTGSIKDEYEVDVTLTPQETSGYIGTVNYITIKYVGTVKNTASMCSGDLFLIAATSIGISVEERIVRGKETCGARSVVNLAKNTNGTLEYSVRVADLVGTGVLRKVTP